MTGRALDATEVGAKPYGAAVISAAAANRSGWLLLGDPGPSEVPEGRLSELLHGSFGIGGIIPGPGGADPEPGHLYRRGVSVVSSEILAVLASVVAASRIDPDDVDPESVIAAVLSRLRETGLRVVCDPQWTTAASPEVSLEPADPDLSRILVVTGALESSRLGSHPRSVWDLVCSVAAHARHHDLVVAAAERCRWPGEATILRDRGIRVQDGPIDWKYWFEGQRAAFSHVILTESGLQSSARQWIDSTQPQALKILFWPSIPSREVSALAAITPGEELAGLDLVIRSVEERMRAVGRWADALWCESQQDAAFLTAFVPDRPAFHIPPALTSRAVSRYPNERSGVAVVAVEGYDVMADNEGAATRALEIIVPQIRWRDPQLACTVVADSPTPMLQEAARAAGAAIVPARDMEQVIESARLLLAVHEFGAGQPAAIMQALEAGTPFVATPHAVANLELGRLRPLAIFGSEHDISARAVQLLTSRQAWAAFSDSSKALLAEEYGPGRRSAALTRALAFCGIDAGPAHERWPEGPEPCDRPPRSIPARVGLRPDASPGPPPLTTPTPVGERERYQMWVERSGPTAAVLRTIRVDLDRLRSRPRISILMPVYNTDPRVLLEAIDSVRAQIYPHWQLCIANDGSDRSETCEVLASLEGQASISIVELPGSTGISGATNAALALADGEYVTFLDHDDVLKPHALAQVARWVDADPTLDVVYSDEDKLDLNGQLYEPHLKPDWSPDLLTTQNYLCHLTVARRSLVEAVGGFRSEYDGSQDYDLFLRLTELTDRIGHIPEPLYSWRAVPGSAAADEEAKPYALEAARRAVADALRRRGYGDRVDTTSRIGCFRARYPLPGRPKVSIIIPTKDQAELLKRCITSILERSTYPNFEIVVIDNQSSEQRTLGYLARTPARVIRYPARFNYARMMNFAARSVESDALLFLNNDTEVIAPDWIEGMLEHAMRPEVGAVGGRLYFGDGEPQHEGIMLAVGGGWAHNVNHRGYWARGELTRNVTAVTGACTMIRPSVYWRVGGNDERLRVAYNDVDLCLRIRQAGYEVIYTPFAELFHYESASRSGYEHPMDGPLFGTRWHPRDKIDPYYSPILSELEPFAIQL